MEQILLKASGYVGIILLGYLLRRVGFFKPGDHRILVKIVLNLTLPAAVVSNFASSEFDSSLLLVTLASLTMGLAMWGFGWLMSLGKDRQTRVLYTLNFPGYNIGAFAMPYIQGFLGASGVVITSLFDAGNALICTGGSYAMTARAVGGKSQSLGACLKKLLTAPFCTYLLMLGMALLRIPVPGCIVPAAGIIGSANGFLAMLMLGAMFEFHPDRRFLRQAGTVLGCRYGAAALFAAICWFVLPLSPEVRRVLVIICFAPIPVMTAVFTENLGGDGALSSFTGSVSILISIVVMTLLIALLGLG